MLTAGVGGPLFAGSVLVADGIRFSVFTPLTSSAGPTADEAAPITFGNPAFEQQSIADRNTQLADNKPNSGNWDMITTNETGPERGRLERLTRPTVFSIFADKAPRGRHNPQDVAQGGNVKAAGRDRAARGLQRWRSHGGRNQHCHSENDCVHRLPPTRKA